MKFISLDSLNKSPERDFDKLIKKTPSFVKFYHPSCHHCNEMAPNWKGLKHDKKNKDKHVNIIEVHADIIPDIKSDCAKNIPGYPTIMEVKQNGKAGKEYNGDRSKDDLIKFILQHFKNKTIKMKQDGGSNHKKHTKKHTKKNLKKKRKKRKKHTKKIKA